jgi:hypothetical protein
MLTTTRQRKGNVMATDADADTEVLINVLRELEVSSEVQALAYPYMFLTDMEVTYELVDRVLMAANVALIDNLGQCNNRAINIVTAAGFPVTRGEYDSSGWLTGVIQTSKGKIVYG